MHRIDTSTAEADTHGPGKDGFTDGNPGMAIPPTDLDDDFFNAVQEELCNTIEGQGITLVKGTNTQLLSALRSPVGSGANPAIDGTGGSTSGPGLRGTGGAPNGRGLIGQGTGVGTGVEGTGGTSNGSGVKGTGGATNGVGVEGVGTGSGTGVQGTGGGTNGIGIEGFGTGTGAGLYGYGGSSNGEGVIGEGAGTGAGLHGIGGATGYGVVGVGGATSGAGVTGTGTAGNSVGGAFQGQGSGSGATGTGGATSGAIGVRGVGGSTDGVGVKGEGVGTGHGVHGVGANGCGVVAESDTASPSRAALRVVPQDNDPSSPQEGDIYYNSTFDRLLHYANSGWRGPWKVGAITSASASRTTSGQFSQTVSIPDSSMRVGTVLRVTAGIAISACSGGSVSFAIRIGGSSTAEITYSGISGAHNVVISETVTVRGPLGASCVWAYAGLATVDTGPTSEASVGNITESTVSAQTLDVGLTLISGTITATLENLTVEVLD